MLALEILGSLSLRDDARALPLAAQQRRRLGLLGILALAGKQGLARDRLEAYLWPDSSAALARHSLDQTVYALRNALAPDVILSVGREMQLNPDVVGVDVWEFEFAMLGGNWLRALELYKGTLLDGIHIADSGEL